MYSRRNLRTLFFPLLQVLADFRAPAASEALEEAEVSAGAEAREVGK